METVAQLIKLGDDCLKDKNYDMAIYAYSSALSNGNYAKLTDVMKKRSNCYFHISKYACAYDDIIEVQKTLPHWIAGYKYAANCLVKLDDFESVCELYTKGLESNAGNAELQNGLLEAKSKMATENITAAGNNPLSFCKLDYYPGDDCRLEKEKITRDTIEQAKSENIINQSKNRSLAELVRESWKHKQNGDVKKASECVTAAVQMNPEVTCVRQALGELLYFRNEFEEAFRYLTVIPKSLRNFDTWMLGGKVLQELELPVSAEMWLRHAAKVGGKRADNAALLFQDIRSRRLYKNLTTDKIVEVRFTEKGRALFAKEDIARDKPIFEDTQIILAQTNDSSNIKACSNCAKNLETAKEYFGKEVLEANSTLQDIADKHWPNFDVISCSGCNLEFYCSDICREFAWEQHHQILCISVNESMKTLYDVCNKYKLLLESKQRVWEGMWNAAFSPMLLARLWAAILCEAKRQAKDRGVAVPETRDWIRAKLPYRRFIANSPCSYAEMVPEMVKIMRDVFKDPGTGLAMEISDREFDGRYFQLACNVQAFSDPDPPFKKFAKSVKSAGVGLEVAPFVCTEESYATFGGLFCLHATLNHSCDNNAEVHDGPANGKPGVNVIANRTIKRGEEITITYIDTRMSRQNRRAWLIRAYNFWCQCMRCRFEGDDSGFCTNCNKQASEKNPFLGCGRCRNAWYCSPQCQKNAWKKGHKGICRKR